MATLAFSTVGAGIGSYTGIGSGTGWQIGSMLGQALVGQKSDTPAGLSDLKITGSSYGQVIPTVFGTMRLGGNMIWAGPLNKQAAETQGGKGSAGGGASQFLYTASFAMAICNGEMGEILKIWADGNLIFDAQSSSTKKMKGLNFRFYKGDEEQTPDSIMEADLGAGNAPAYRGICYLVFDELPLSEFGNRLPNIEVLVTEAGRQDFPFSERDTRNFHPDQLCLQDDGEYLYSYEVDGGTNLLRKIDTDNLSVVSEAAIGSEFPALPSSLPGLSVDREGDLWGGTGYAKLPDRTLFKFNTKLMAVERQVQLPAHIGAVNYSVDIKPFETGPSFLIAGSQQSGQVTVFDEYLSVIGNTETTALTSSGAFRDEAENAWIIMSGNLALSSLSPVSIVRVSMGQRTGGEGAVYIPSFEKFDIGQSELINVTGIANNITRLVCYLPRTREIVLINDHRLMKWSLDNQTITLVRDGDFSNYQNLNQRIADSSLLFKRSMTELIYVDIETLEDIETVELGNYVSGIDVDAAVYDEVTDSLITLARDTPVRRLLLRRIKGEGASYQHIFQNILRSADLNDSDFDISNVTGEVEGYLVAREGSIQAAMEPLLRLGDVDLVESDFKLILQTCSNKAPVEISEDDLLSPLQTSRLQEAELARSVSLTHYNTDTGFLPGIQQVKRIENPSSVVFGKNDVSYQVPVALSGVEAKQFVLQNLKAVWKERNVGQFQLPIKYLHLDPADRLHIADTDIRITQTHFLQDLSLEVETVGSRSLPSELGEVTADSGKGYVEIPVAQAKKTDLFLLDLPLLEDSHASGGEAAQHYYAVSNKSSTWTNSAVFVSDNNTRFDLAQIFSHNVTWGFAVNALPPPQHLWRIDKENYLDVEFLNGKERVEAVSELELLSGKNLLLVGEELVQFSNVKWLSSTRVRLKNLIRGRRGTEDMVTSHKVAEKVILLNSDTISKRRISLSSLNMTKYFRAVSSGELLEDAKSIPQKFTGRDLKPYAPVISNITKTSATIEINWYRRSRIASSGLSASPPLAEREERYELEFFYGGKQASVFVSAAQTFTYTLDQFNEQFGEAMVQIPTINLLIYQLSEAVGRGIAAIKENI